MKIAVLLFIFLSTFNVFAEDCAPASVSTKNMPKNNNQAEQNWCVFWTSADLLSFYEETPLSSFDMALQYFNNDLVRDESINDYIDIGGNISAALLLSIQSQKGICLESQTNFTNDNWFALSLFFKKLGSPKKKLIQVLCEENLENAYPFKDIPKNILTILNKLSGDKKSAALLDVTCGERFKLKNKYGLSKRDIEKFKPNQMIEKLDQLLTSGDPSSVTFDWDFLVSDKDYSKKDSNDPALVDHTTTIIGRRFNEKTNKCEYQIKDTAGNNRCNPRFKYECEKSNGTLWVPRENLQKNMYEINWLVKR